VAIALSAAKISLKHTLPVADAVVSATATEEGCPAVTYGPHFNRASGIEDAMRKVGVATISFACGI